MAFQQKLVMNFTMSKREIDKTSYCENEIKIDILIILKINLIFKVSFLIIYI